NAQLTGSITTQTLNVQSNATATISGAKVSANTMAVIGNGRVTVSSGGDKVLVLSSISIDPSAQLDLSNNFMIVNYGSETTHATRATIRNLLINGRGGPGPFAGGWNGSGGIASSFAHANGNGFNLAIGYADNAELATHNAFGSYTAFAGQTVASTTV